MKRNLSDYLVALSVIACSIVLLGALTIALSGYRLKKPARTLQINYEDVTGRQSAFRSPLRGRARRTGDRDAPPERADSEKSARTRETPCA